MATNRKPLEGVTWIVLTAESVTNGMTKINGQTFPAIQLTGKAATAYKAASEAQRKATEAWDTVQSAVVDGLVRAKKLERDAKPLFSRNFGRFSIGAMVDGDDVTFATKDGATTGQGAAKAASAGQGVKGLKI